MNHSLKCKKNLHVKILHFINHQFHDRRDIKSLSVWSVSDQCCIYITDSEDPCTYGNFIPCLIGRLSAAIIILMMVQDTLQYKV